MNGKHMVTNAICEAHNNGLITEDTAETFLSYCEAADMSDPEDVAGLGDIIEYLEDAENNPEVDYDDEPMTESELKLLIYESESIGDISPQQRDLLLNMMEAAG